MLLRAKGSRESTCASGLLGRGIGRLRTRRLGGRGAELGGRPRQLPRRRVSGFSNSLFRALFLHWYHGTGMYPESTQDPPTSQMPLSRAVLVLAMPAVAAALMSRTIAPMTSRAAATVRVARPVMLVESVDAVTSVVQSGVVDTLPQMMLADSGELLESITSLSPAAQAVYCASGESNPCVTTTSQFGGSR